MRSFARTSPRSTTRHSGRSRRWRSTGRGARAPCPPGSATAVPFEYPQARLIADAFARHGVRYLFIGKSGAVVLGYPDTTQDADVFLDKVAGNGAAAVA